MIIGSLLLSLLMTFTAGILFLLCCWMAVRYQSTVWRTVASYASPVIPTKPITKIDPQSLTPISVERPISIFAAQSMGVQFQDPSDQDTSAKWMAR
jgi:hypothetical protein